MTEKVIIIGAGGDGRNVAEIINSTRSDLELMGFLDDDDLKQETLINGIPVLGKTTDIDRFRDLRLLICLGNPLSLFTKKKIMESLGIGTNRLITLIHANAIVSKTATIGNGSIILSGVTVMANTTIGSSCYIASNSNIGHDTILHDYAFVAPLVGVPGNVKIEQGAYLGISSCIRGGVTVGEWSVVGMGSVVTSDVSPYHVVAGNPAKTIRVRNASDFKF